MRAPSGLAFSVLGLYSAALVVDVDAQRSTVGRPVKKSLSSIERVPVSHSCNVGNRCGDGIEFGG